MKKMLLLLLAAVLLLGGCKREKKPSEYGEGDYSIYFTNGEETMLIETKYHAQATDAHGFSVVPEGFLDREAGRQALASKDAFFWTYTKNEKGGLSGAYVFHISGNDAAIEGERFFKRRQYNVRCIRDR